MKRLLIAALVAFAAALGARHVLAVGNIKPIVLDFVFDARKYSQFGFPKYCSAYMALENPKKRRPLILYGWGIANTLRMTFDYSEGRNEKFTRKFEGAATTGLNGYSCTVMGDWNDYAAAPLLLRQPRPIVFVTVSNLVDVQLSDKALQDFFKDDKERIGAAFGDGKRRPEEGAPALEFAAKADVEVRAGPHSFTLPAAPVKANVARTPNGWTLTFGSEFRFEGTKLGFTGDDAGEISMQVTYTGWCVPPERFAVKPVAEQIKEELKRDPTQALDLELGD